MITNLTPAEPLLVTVRPGLVEVTGSCRELFNVHVVEVPEIKGADAELALERLLSLTLPQPFRDLVVNGERLASRPLRRLRPADVAERLEAMRILAAIEKLGGNLQ